jgi:G3E family GTPase
MTFPSPSIQRCVVSSFEQFKRIFVADAADYPQVVVENKKSNPTFAGLLRSKGFFWLATRPSLHGEWSQAGAMLTLQGGGPWFCTLDDGKHPTPHSPAVSSRK